MMAPCGKPTKANRFGDDPAAVFAHTVAAGFIASSSGSAMVAPTPFNTERREMCFRNKDIAFSVLMTGHCRHGLRRASHSELIASNYGLNERRKPVVAACGAMDD